MAGGEASYIPINCYRKVIAARSTYLSRYLFRWADSWPLSLRFAQLSLYVRFPGQSTYSRRRAGTKKAKMVAKSVVVAKGFHTRIPPAGGIGLP